MDPVKDWLFHVKTLRLDPVADGQPLPRATRTICITEERDGKLVHEERCRVTGTLLDIVEADNDNREASDAVCA